MTTVPSHRWYALFIWILIPLSGCNQNIKPVTNPSLAADIYVDLATYYWQAGYPNLAYSRLAEALIHNPSHAQANALKSQWQGTPDEVVE